MAKLASTKRLGLNRTVIEETLDLPRTEVEKVMMIERGESWMTPIIEYLTNEHLPEEELEARKI